MKLYFEIVLKFDFSFFFVYLIVLETKVICVLVSSSHSPVSHPLSRSSIFIIR